MILWEYHVERALNPTRLNELGAQGWELVTVAAPGSGLDFTAFFKRPLVQHQLLLEEAEPASAVQ